MNEKEERERKRQYIDFACGHFPLGSIAWLSDLIQILLHLISFRGKTKKFPFQSEK